MQVDDDELRIIRARIVALEGVAAAFVLFLSDAAGERWRGVLADLEEISEIVVDRTENGGVPAEEGRLISACALCHVDAFFRRIFDVQLVAERARIGAKRRRRLG